MFLNEEEIHIYKLVDKGAHRFGHDRFRDTIEQRLKTKVGQVACGRPRKTFKKGL